MILSAYCPFPKSTSRSQSLPDLFRYTQAATVKPDPPTIVEVSDTALRYEVEAPVNVYSPSCLQGIGAEGGDGVAVHVSLAQTWRLLWPQPVLQHMPAASPTVHSRLPCAAHSAAAWSNATAVPL